MNRALVVLTFAGAAAMLVGAWLDWSGVEYASTTDRWLSACAGGIAALAAGVARYRPRALAAAVAGGALGLNMAVVNIRDIAGHDYEYAAYPDAAVGVGLYVVLAGAVVALATGLTSLLPVSRRPAAP